MAYVVARGDTLGKIARRYGTSVEAILTSNPSITDAGQISVGQILRMPEARIRPTVGGGSRPTADRSSPGPVGFDATSGISSLSKLEDMEACLPADSFSEDGAEFIFTREACPGISNRLHWPGGGSGVTLGPGYDMKERTSSEIEKDLVGIGVDLAAAQAIGKAAGLKGAAAQTFASDNKDLVNLTKQQEFTLLDRVVPPYVNAVANNVKVPISQNQFDALVSLTYNIGVTAFQGSATVRELNRGNYKGACDHFMDWNKTKKDGVLSVDAGLTKRRKMEQDVFNSIPEVP